MSDFTEEQVATYLHAGGNLCPDCGGDSLTTIGNIVVDSGSAWQRCRCDECSAKWFDLYKLVGVERNE